MKTIALTGPYNDVTRATLHKHVPEGFRLIDVPSQADYALLKEADYMIIRTLNLGKADLQDAPKMRLVQKWGAGYDMIDVAGIAELDIPVAICTGVNAPPVAEMAVLHMLALYRHFTALGEKLRKGIWAKDTYSARAFMLKGKKVGIIGLGNIGRHVAQIVQGFGAEVSYFDIKRRSEEQERSAGVSFLPLEELLATCDIVSLHAPLNEHTLHLIDEKALAQMKESAILINTARGEMVDEAALFAALKNGTIAGAGLDALPKEPPEDDWPFFTLENVSLTPHTGGNTADNDINMITRCFENISKVERGQPLGLRDVVNNHLLKTKLPLED